jgi:hypothetical protein
MRRHRRDRLRDTHDGSGNDIAPSRRTAKTPDGYSLTRAIAVHKRPALVQEATSSSSAVRQDAQATDQGDAGDCHELVEQFQHRAWVRLELLALRPVGGSRGNRSCLLPPPAPRAPAANSSVISDRCPARMNASQAGGLRDSIDRDLVWPARVSLLRDAASRRHFVRPPTKRDRANRRE